MAQSKVKTARLIKLFRKFGNVNAVTKRCALSYMAVRVRLVKAGIIEGKTFMDYKNGK